MKIFSHILLLFIVVSLATPKISHAQEVDLEPSLNIQEIDVDAIDNEGDSNALLPDDLEQASLTEGAAEEAKEPLYITDMLNRAALSQSRLILERVGSLFYNSYELQLIKEARKGYTTRAPTETEIDESQKEKSVKPRKKGPREIQVSGIIYSSSKDWTVWLNGQKITPDRLPPEILDIDVRKDYIKVKWFDSYTNQIYPIKIKTHQRFNLDTRIFLPG